MTMLERDKAKALEVLDELSRLHPEDLGSIRLIEMFVNSVPTHSTLYVDVEQVGSFWKDGSEWRNMQTLDTGVLLTIERGKVADLAKKLEAMQC